jgi:FimV-like protein
VPVYSEKYRPLNDAEMEAELDQIEAATQHAHVATQLREAEQALARDDQAEAMALLSTVLRQGDDAQREQARALLKRL